ncbi:hypothetical protein [Nostoc sp.]|uniref:hypothetical protein n=1 Tax=Nostoc sp. TaxID=1180 RepID=UPI00359445B1
MFRSPLPCLGKSGVNFTQMFWRSPNVNVPQPALAKVPGYQVTPAQNQKFLSIG